jgi:hypothetical protein
LQDTLAKVSDFGNHDEDHEEYGPEGRGLQINNSFQKNGNRYHEDHEDSDEDDTEQFGPESYIDTDDYYEGGHRKK